MKICFFAKVEHRSVLDIVQFYATDIRLLSEMGHEVVTATTFRDIPTDCDIYFVWWWTYALLPLLKAKLAGKPCVVTGTFDFDTCRDLPDSVCYINRPWWQQQVLAAGLRFDDANIFLSQFELDLVTRHLPVKNPRLAYAAVDHLTYTPANVPREPFLLNVAWSAKSNARRKCLPQIIGAFARVAHNFPDLRLVMAGRQGDLHPELVALSDRLNIGDRVDFLGAISEQKKIDLMQKCAVYLQPTMHEGFGLASAEAMSCGAAVVSSPVGAVPEVLGDSGVMVDGTSEAAIADAISALLSDPAHRHELGAKARRRIEERFTLAKRRASLAAVIDDVLTKRAL